MCLITIHTASLVKHLNFSTYKNSQISSHFLFILSLALFPQRKMARSLGFLVCLLSLCFIGSTVADWNILAQKGNKLNKLGISLKNYCEAWRINVELNNIKSYDVVPEECAEQIGKYMTSTQYKVDSERALEESLVFINSYFYLKGDEKDAWIFDVDDTLISTVPYFKKHRYGGDKLNSTTFEDWVRERKAPALPSSLILFNEIKAKGLKIFLISSRSEYLRDATIDNLVQVGYHGWTGLILRDSDDTCKTVQKYKAEERQRLVDRGYRLWGIVADQWSSIQGLPSAIRTYKLPNSMYFVA